MTPIIDIERGASQLRYHLKRAQLPELRLLCGLRFFRLLASHAGIDAESYFREFLPIVAQAARKSNPRELLPEEIESLCQLIKLAAEVDPSVVLADDLTALEDLRLATKTSQRLVLAAPGSDDAIVVNCLFAEYYPDLDLSPRGRLLAMRVTASPITSKAQTDDVVIRNPVEEPDDRFLTQARDSISAARSYLHRQLGLSLTKRYRFDFAVNSTGARFTGDSLGVAFAIGAIAAVSQIEVFREQLSVRTDAVFSGALLPDGTLSAVDSEALRLKIYRALHSGAHSLVVPFGHLAEAETYVHELKNRIPGRTLDLAGADTLDALLADPIFVQRVPLSPSTYRVRKLARASRSVKLQIPVLFALVAMLYAIICSQYPKAWIGFDWNPQYVRLTERGFEALNKDSIFLWDVEYECKGIHTQSKWKVGDLDGDGENEVVFTPKQLRAEPCDINANLFVYESDGKERFRRHLAVRGEYPADTSSPWPYGPAGIRFIGSEDQVTILTAATRSMPSQTHIRLWSATGDSLGWYVNSGATTIDDRLFSDAIDGSFAFVGINNKMACVFLLVIPRVSSFGVSPPYRTANLTRGNQRAYILFPPSDLSRLYPRPYNGTDGLVAGGNNTVRVATREVPDSRASLYYYLDRSLRVTHVSSDDSFAALRATRIHSGILDAIPDSIYYANLRDSVKYWTDSGWVTEGQLRASEDIR